MDRRFSIKAGRCLSCLAILFCYAAISWAGVPVDSDKILALKEKELLVSTVYSYKQRIYDFQTDVLRLKSDREWLDVKILRIEDRKRPVPTELRRAMQQIDEKLSHHDSEIQRLSAMIDKHLDGLRQVDTRVKKANGNHAPDWWSFAPWIYQLMYPGKKQVTGPPRSPLMDRAASHDAYAAKDSSLRQDLEQKIKDVELDNWVALMDDHSGLSLEVQLPILFGEGKSNVAKDYLPFFKKLSWLLKSYPIHVEVSGYADGKTSNPQPLASRMALGANRAANVVQELVESGLSPGAFKVTTEDEYGKADPEKQSLSAAMKRRVDVRVFFLENQG